MRLVFRGFQPHTLKTKWLRTNMLVHCMLNFFLLLWNVPLYCLIIHYSKFFFNMNFTSTNLYKNNVNNKAYCTAKYGVSAILCRMAHAVMTAIACQCNHNVSFLESLTILFSFFPLFLQTFPLRTAGIRCCLPSDILHIRYLHADKNYNNLAKELRACETLRIFKITTFNRIR